jgi:nitroreductase
MAAPVTVVVAYDLRFYEKLPKLSPHNPRMRDLFVSNPPFVEETARRNSSLQGAYLIIAARSLGLDCGPMSGFNNARLDEEFFGGGHIKSNFLATSVMATRPNYIRESHDSSSTRRARSCERSRIVQSSSFSLPG